MSVNMKTEVQNTIIDTETQICVTETMPVPIALQRQSVDKPMKAPPEDIDALFDFGDLFHTDGAAEQMLQLMQLNQHQQLLHQHQQHQHQHQHHGFNEQDLLAKRQCVDTVAEQQWIAPPYVAQQGMSTSGWLMNTAGELQRADDTNLCYGSQSAVSEPWRYDCTSGATIWPVNSDDYTIHHCDSTPNINGIQCGSSMGFPTGNGNGMKLQELQVLSKESSTAESVETVPLVDSWFGTKAIPYTFVLAAASIHFWYGLQQRSNLAMQTKDFGLQVDLWLRQPNQLHDHQWSTIGLTDVLWFGEQKVALKLLLCILCILGSMCVKHVEWLFPSIGETPVMQKQRTSELHERSLRVIRNVFLLGTSYLLMTNIALFYGMDATNYPDNNPVDCARAVAVGITISFLGPSTLSKIYTCIRWVMIWIILPVQILLYLGFGDQFVTLCCHCNIIAQTCTLNFARFHIMGILYEWSARKHAQEMLWVLACFVLPVEFGLGLRLLAATAASCAVVCVKVWISRMYYYGKKDKDESKGFLECLFVQEPTGDLCHTPTEDLCHMYFNAASAAV